jgi:uncharacterized protein
MLNTLLVLQPIDLCNLNCTYCYLPGRRNPNRMSEAVLEEIIRKSLSASPRVLGGSTTIVWHGGEPMLAGIDFYRTASVMIEKYKPNSLHVAQAVQTNATLLTDEWARWFSESKVSVSVSLDGPKKLHDRMRVNWQGKGSFDEVMAGVECLRRNKLPLRAICVVSNYSLDYPEEIFEFFRDRGFESLSFNIDEIEGANRDSSYGDLGSEALAQMVQRFAEFLSRIYDLWEQNGRPMWVREFDGTIDRLRARGLHPSTFLHNSETLGLSIITITYLGDISTFSPELSGGTQCDSRAFTITNIHDISCLDDLLGNLRLRELAREVNEGTSLCANHCDYFDVCGGGSPSNKFFEHGSFRVAETAFCKLQRKVVVDVILGKLLRQHRERAQFRNS